MSKLILEILDDNRLKSFNKLKDFKQYGILGGGTALALQIGHRKSYDFDIFIDEPVNKNIWKKVKELYGENSYKTLDTPDQLNLVTENGINITFFLDDYINQFELIKNDSIDIMNIKDIACNKAFIQGKRPKWRDYVDLYFILKDKHVSLEELIKLSLNKFGNDFSERLFLEQLVYWEDIMNYEIEYVNKPVPVEEIKKFLIDEVKNYRDKFLN